MVENVNNSTQGREPFEFLTDKQRRTMLLIRVAKDRWGVQSAIAKYYGKHRSTICRLRQRAERKMHEEATALFSPD